MKSSNKATVPHPALVLVVVLLVGFAFFWTIFEHLDYSWNWRVPWTYRQLFVQGFWMTLAISTGAIVLGFGFGLLGGLARVSGNPFARQAAALYIELFRGTPLLVQIYISYFCVATVIRFDNPYVIGTITLALFSGAYISEMVRAGIQSVDKGQIEAARSSGLNDWQTMRHVVFPQAMKRIIPPVTGQFVSLIKDSSLLSVISVYELTKASEVINAATYKTFEAYLPLAGLYLMITYPLSYMTRRLEERMTHD